MWSTVKVNWKSYLRGWLYGDFHPGWNFISAYRVEKNRNYMNISTRFENLSTLGWIIIASRKYNNFCLKFFTLSLGHLFICSFSVFTFTWYSLKSISLTSSKSLYGFSPTEARPNATGSSSYISAKSFLTFSYKLALLAFESQFLNYLERLNSCKHFMRLVSFSSIHLKRACEVAIFIF